MEFEQFLDIINKMHYESNESVREESESVYHEFVAANPLLVVQYLFTIFETEQEPKIYKAASILFGVFFRNIPAGVFSGEQLAQFIQSLIQIFINETNPNILRNSIGYAIIILNKMGNGNTGANEFFLQASLSENEDISLNAMECIITSHRMQLFNAIQYRDAIIEFFTAIFQETVSLARQQKAMCIVYLSSYYIDCSDLREVFNHFLTNLSGDDLVSFLDNINEFIEYMKNFLEPCKEEVLDFLTQVITSEAEENIKKSAVFLIENINILYGAELKNNVPSIAEALIASCVGLEEMDISDKESINDSLFGAVISSLDNIINEHSNDADVYFNLIDINAKLATSDDLSQNIMFANFLILITTNYNEIVPNVEIMDYIENIKVWIKNENNAMRFYGFKALHTLLKYMSDPQEIQEFGETLEEVVPIIEEVCSNETETRIIKYIIKTFIQLDTHFNPIMQPTFNDQMTIFSAALENGPLVPIALSGYNFFVAKNVQECAEAINQNLLTILSNKDEYDFNVFTKALMIYVDLMMHQSDEYIEENVAQVLTTISEINFDDVTDKDIDNIHRIIRILSRKDMSLIEPIIQSVVGGYLHIIGTEITYYSFDIRTADDELKEYIYARLHHSNQIIAYKKDDIDKLNASLRHVCQMLRDNLIPGEYFGDIKEAVKVNIQDIIGDETKQNLVYVLVEIILHSDQFEDEVDVLNMIIQVVCSLSSLNISILVENVAKCVYIVLQRSPSEIENIGMFLNLCIVRSLMCEKKANDMMIGNESSIDSCEFDDAIDTAKSYFKLAKALSEFFPENFVACFEAYYHLGYFNLEEFISKPRSSFCALYTTLKPETEVTSTLFAFLNEVVSNPETFDDDCITDCLMLMLTNDSVNFSKDIFPIIAQGAEATLSCSNIIDRELGFCAALFILKYEGEFDMSPLIPLIEHVTEKYAESIANYRLNSPNGAYLFLSYIKTHGDSPEPYTELMQKYVVLLSSSEFTENPICAQLIQLFSS